MSGGAVVWKDLLPLGRHEVAAELLISAPWLAATAAAAGAVLLALACAFMFFLTGLRQVHNAYHHALGLSRRATDVFLLVMSVLMLGSMHAVKFNHLRHHRLCMRPGDVEAMSARLRGWQAVAVGPLFPLLLHATAIRLGGRRERLWVGAELAASALWVTLVFGVLDVAWLRFHVLAMAGGQCLTAFFAVWTVHHDCPPGGPASRTLRGRWRTRLTYSMFFHHEHHLYPAVPTCRLATLAARIDAACAMSAASAVSAAQPRRVF